MAFIDYGAIAFKNKKLISTDVFTPMKILVDFPIKKQEKNLILMEINLLFVWWTMTLCVGFYKTLITWKS